MRITFRFEVVWCVRMDNGLRLQDGGYLPVADVWHSKFGRLIGSQSLTRDQCVTERDQAFLNALGERNLEAARKLGTTQ